MAHLLHDKAMFQALLHVQTNDHPYFTGEKTEAQNGSGFEPKQSGSLACACNH